MRFLFEWQRVSPEARMAGPEALEEVLQQLAGFEAPAAAWEKEILPARLEAYDRALLDEACLAGRVAWARLTPINGKSKTSRRRATPLKSTPISLVPRRHAAIWASHSPAAHIKPSANAGKIVEFIQENGASFFEELVEGTHLLRAQVEESLAELVALGLVSSDSFGGLRALLAPASTRRRASLRRRRGTGLEAAGRWALAWSKRAQKSATANHSERVEHIARTLLHRYGVVFLRMLEREAAWLPKWRELLRVYRRLEARGEIRGGRFVAGFSGEQFALPEAITKLREVRRQNTSETLISLSGADPLNLAGILMPGPKLPALTGNRVLYRDGIPLALLQGDEMQFLLPFDPRHAGLARMALLGQIAPAQQLPDVVRRQGTDAHQVPNRRPRGREGRATA